MRFEPRIKHIWTFDTKPGIFDFSIIFRDMNFFFLMKFSRKNYRKKDCQKSETQNIKNPRLCFNLPCFPMLYLKFHLDWSNTKGGDAF